MKKTTKIGFSMHKTLEDLRSERNKFYNSLTKHSDLFTHQNLQNLIGENKNYKNTQLPKLLQAYVDIRNLYVVGLIDYDTFILLEDYFYPKTIIIRKLDLLDFILGDFAIGNCLDVFDDSWKVAEENPFITRMDRLIVKLFELSETSTIKKYDNTIRSKLIGKNAEWKDIKLISRFEGDRWIIAVKYKSVHLGDFSMLELGIPRQKAGTKNPLSNSPEALFKFLFYIHNKEYSDFKKKFLDNSIIKSKSALNKILQDTFGIYSNAFHQKKKYRGAKKIIFDMKELETNFLIESYDENINLDDYSSGSTNNYE